MLIEVLVAMTMLWLVLVIMGQSLVFDQQLLNKADQEIIHGLTVRNCCRYAKSLGKQRLQLYCPTYLRHPKSLGDWSIGLSGTSCLVSWSYKGKDGYYTLLV